MGIVIICAFNHDLHVHVYFQLILQKPKALVLGYCSPPPLPNKNHSSEEILIAFIHIDLVSVVPSGHDWLHEVWLN